MRCLYHECPRTRDEVRGNVDSSAEPGRTRDEEPGTPDAKGLSRQRSEPSAVPAGSPGRPPQDTRRKRGNEQRYAGWGDGIEHMSCARAKHALPEIFPVASHAGAATIPATIVARRPDGLLLCTFSHHGPHLWPDGELVDDEPATVPATGEIP
jgi:hypothetical protein